MSIISFNKKTLIKFSKLSNLITKKSGVELLRAIENNVNVGSFKITKIFLS